MSNNTNITSEEYDYPDLFSCKIISQIGIPPYMNFTIWGKEMEVTFYYLYHEDMGGHITENEVCDLVRRYSQGNTYWNSNGYCYLYIIRRYSGDRRNSRGPLDGNDLGKFLQFINDEITKRLCDESEWNLSEIIQLNNVLFIKSDKIKYDLLEGYQKLLKFYTAYDEKLKVLQKELSNMHTIFLNVYFPKDVTHNYIDFNDLSGTIYAKFARGKINIHVIAYIVLSQLVTAALRTDPTDRIKTCKKAIEKITTPKKRPGENSTIVNEYLKNHPKLVDNINNEVKINNETFVETC